MKYIPKTLSTIFRLHEVLGGKKNYPLYSDYMKYWGKNKIIHYIPITWSIGEKIKLSTIFQLHEVLGKIKLSTILRLHEVPGKK